MLEHSEIIYRTDEEISALDMLSKAYLNMVEYVAGYFGDTSIGNILPMLILPSDSDITEYNKLMYSNIKRLRSMNIEPNYFVCIVNNKLDLYTLLRNNGSSNIHLYIHDMDGYNILKKTILSVINSSPNVTVIKSTSCGNTFNLGR